ncbi:hypothetical protein RHS04_03941 [Rhizoctonia solani]|uniref:Uncharacterized protein n=1 Tax=Rhizoctonia solani TaxID=456999 RepID=A0A8H7HB98_9AGAM|nr:hypothetical protein RHS04_03941 [Rhizoctonia solani]
MSFNSTNSTSAQSSSPLASTTVILTGPIANSSSTSSVSASSSTSSGFLSVPIATGSAKLTTRVPSTVHSHSGSTTFASQILSSTSLSRTFASQDFASRASSTSPSTSSASSVTTASSSRHVHAARPTSQKPEVSTQTNSTSLLRTTSYEPSLTMELQPALTAVPETSRQIIHRLIIDLGECASFTSPRFLLNGGELGDLVSIGNGIFQIELKSDPDSGIFGLVVSLRDDEVRCGAADSTQCMGVLVSFGLPGNDISVSILSAGDSGIAMYPVNMWLEDGVTWGAQLANSPADMYHCWGWDDTECPYAIKVGSTISILYRPMVESFVLQGHGPEVPLWTLSANNPTGDIYVEFCPSDAPPWYNIPMNPHPDSFEPTRQGTYIVLPTQTTVLSYTFVKPTALPTTFSPVAPSGEAHCDVLSTCVRPNTYVIEEETTTSWSTFMTPHFLSMYPSTSAPVYTTATMPETTLATTPTSAATPSAVNTSIKPLPLQTAWPSSALTESATSPTAVSGSYTTPISSAPQIVPTYSYITDSLGSVVSTLTYDVTVSPTPITTSPPDTQNILSSWTTWMTVNGSTVPAIAGEVGVVSTLSETYLLESGSIIPVSELSTRTTKSSQTGGPSSSTEPASANGDLSSQSQGGRIAGAVVGTLVGLVLGSLLVWYICHCRQRRRRRDSFARGDPSWLAPRHEVGSGSESRLRVDLNEEPRMSRSYIEPWVPPRTTVQSSRKGGQPEMESVSGSYGVSRMAGLSREPESSSNEGGSSWSHHSSSDQHQAPVVAATQTGRLPTTNKSVRRPDMVSQRAVPASYLNPSLANPSLSLLPTAFQNEPSGPLVPSTPAIHVAPLPNQASRSPREGPSRRRDVSDEEQGGRDAIPPLYNEAWKTTR